MPVAHFASRRFAALFDHLVVPAQQRYVDANGLGGFQVDDHFDLGGLIERQIGWLFTP